MRINIRQVTGAVVLLLAVASVTVRAADLRLAEAARNQSTEAVRTLLAEGAAVNAVSPTASGRCTGPFSGITWRSPTCSSKLAQT